MNIACHRRAFLACLAQGAAVLSGCAGYQVGTRSLYRPDIRTVHVPIVRSDSLRRFLGERLTEAIVKKIEQDSPMKVVDAAAADSVLTTRLVTETKRVVAETRNDDVRDIETDFFVQVSWADRRGDLIMGPTQVPVEPLLLNISQAANFVPEGGQSIATAHQVALTRLADQIVGQMEMAW